MWGDYGCGVIGKWNLWRSFIMMMLNVSMWHIGTHKLVVMGHINFKDHALIKRRWVDEKMNVTGGMFKDEKKTK